MTSDAKPPSGHPVLPRPERRNLGSRCRKLLRRLALFTCGLMPGLFFGCAKSPPTFQHVLEGRIAMATEDREALGGLLRANDLTAESLTIARDASSQGRGSVAHLDGERVVFLKLESVRDADFVGRLTALRELHLEGEVTAFSLHGLPSLELVSLILSPGSLRQLEVSDLAVLHTLGIDGGDLDGGVHLEALPSLENLSLNQCGLQRVPPLSGLPLTDLSLAGNQIRDLGALATLPNLERLHLSGNGMVSLQNLPPLPNLRALYLGHNPLSADVRLAAQDFPQLKTLDLRSTGLANVPPGLQGLPVQWDEEQTEKLDFLATLERLRASHQEAAGELVEQLGSTGGTQLDTEGNCRWKTGLHRRAEVRCRLRIASLRGLSAARLGTTDPAFPFQGGGSPRVHAELQVEEGVAALYVRESFDLVALARQLSGVSVDVAEAARQPQDRFDGYRRLEARPGAAARLEGEPSLLGDRVVLWLEAEQEARSLTLVVDPR